MECLYLKYRKLARNQIDTYLNLLEIKKQNYLEQQQKEYKLTRLQNSLEALKAAEVNQTIPTQIISEIETIFRLMPVHELYYIKVDKEEFGEYIKRVNALYITVEDNYEEYFEESSNSNFPSLVALVYLAWVFLKGTVEERFANYVFSFLIALILCFNFYKNRWYFLKKLPKFNKNV